MSLSLRKTHTWVVDELGRNRSIAESMSAVIDRCAAARPHPDWDRLRELPYDAVYPLVEWLQGVLRSEPPPLSIRGLWFGLCQSSDADGRTVADIYICGADHFWADPNDSDWAVDPSWRPDARRARSEIFADVYRIAYRVDAPYADRQKCLANDAEYPLCLAYGALAVRELLEQVEPKTVLGHSDRVGIAVGFDGGGFIVLGQLTDDGLLPADLNERRPEITIERVLEALRSADGKIVMSGLVSLPRLGELAHPAFPDVLEIAATDRFGLRRWAVLILSQVAPSDARARAAALEALQDRNPSVRCESLRALSSMLGLTTDDFSRIQAMERDPDTDVAGAAERALGEIRSRDATADPPAAIEPLDE